MQKAQCICIDAVLETWKTKIKPFISSTCRLISFDKQIHNRQAPKRKTRQEKKHSNVNRHKGNRTWSSSSHQYVTIAKKWKTTLCTLCFNHRHSLQSHSLPNQNQNQKSKTPNHCDKKPNIASFSIPSQVFVYRASFVTSNHNHLHQIIQNPFTMRPPKPQLCCVCSCIVRSTLAIVITVILADYFPIQIRTTTFNRSESLCKRNVLAQLLSSCSCMLETCMKCRNGEMEKKKKKKTCAPVITKSSTARNLMKTFFSPISVEFKYSV